MPDDGMVWDAARSLHRTMAMTLGTVDTQRNLLPLHMLNEGVQEWFLGVAARMLRDSVGAHLADAAAMQVLLDEKT